MVGSLRMAGGYLLLLCAATISVVALRLFVLDAARVRTRSMTATLLPGDVVLVNKLAYGPSTPAEIPFTSITVPTLRFPALVPYRCGDVVLVNRAVNGEQPRRLLKRIIGLPGDTLEIIHGVVFRNGRELPLPPEAREGGAETVPLFTIPWPGETITLSPALLPVFGPAIAAEGHRIDTGTPVLIDGEPAREYRVRQQWYYLLGDNRGNSIDSRTWGCVVSSEILGKPVMIFWSREEEGDGAAGWFTGIRWDRIGKVVR